VREVASTHSSDLELEVLHLTLEEYLLESAGPESPDKRTGQTEEVQLPAIKSVQIMFVKCAL